jgi:predicted nucleic acid-binding protein
VLVLDANILLRAVLGTKVRTLIETYADSVDLLAPDSAFAEAREHLPEILSKRGLPIQPSMQFLESLQESVQPVACEAFAALEETARRRLKGRDEEDWPVLALALTNGFPIWTEDSDFFGSGVATWTTNRVELFLREASASAESA